MQYFTTSLGPYIIQKPKAVDRDAAPHRAECGKVVSSSLAQVAPKIARVTAKEGGKLVPNDCEKREKTSIDPAVVRRVSTRSATRQKSGNRDVFIPHKDRKLLESISEKKLKRSKRHDTKVSVANNPYKKKKSRSDLGNDGLEELHKALHLSAYDGIEDVSKVIQAEPLEDRKARIIAQNLTKKKRGRPRKCDKESKAGKQGKKPTGKVEESMNGTEMKVQQMIQNNDRDDLAIVKVEQEDDSKKAASRKQDNLADQQLDVENWSLKDIVKWGNARERKLAKEEAKMQPKSYNKPAPVQKKEPLPLHPKVHIKDGKIVVDKESLTVAAQQKEEYTKIVTEDSHSINSMSYVNRLSNDRWSIEDTELFFRALSQFGTDFTLIAQLFPGRQRKHLKKKFCKEGKVNAARIDAAMKASAHATINSYKEMITLLKQSGFDVGSSKT